jgi:hypothetical protein
MTREYRCDAVRLQPDGDYAFIMEPLGVKPQSPLRLLSFDRDEFKLGTVYVLSMVPKGKDSSHETTDRTGALRDGPGVPG